MLLINIPSGHHVRRMHRFPTHKLITLWYRATAKEFQCWRTKRCHAPENNTMTYDQNGMLKVPFIIKWLQNKRFRKFSLFFWQSGMAMNVRAHFEGLLRAVSLISVDKFLSIATLNWFQLLGSGAKWTNPIQWNYQLTDIPCGGLRVTGEMQIRFCHISKYFTALPPPRSQRELSNHVTDFPFFQCLWENIRRSTRERERKSRECRKSGRNSFQIFSVSYLDLESENKRKTK